MRNRLSIASWIALCVFCSCSMLDLEPEDFIDPKNYFNTEEQLNTALNGVYATMAEGALYGNYMLGRMGLSADLGFESSSATDHGTVSFYEVVATDTKIMAYWRTLYAGIGRANMLLENINKPEMDEDERNNIKGQALFLRAYYHFMLVTKFRNIPLILTVPSDGSKEQLQIPQSSPKEVFEKIIADMKEAATLVKPIAEVESGGRVSQSAVYGMLARVCLFMAGEPLKEQAMYEEAKEYAGWVVGNGHHSLNPSYEQIFINYIQDKYDTKESIFEVEFWGNNIGTYTSTAGMVGRNNGIALNSDTYNPIIGASSGTLRTSQYFFSLFDPEDLRRDWTIASFSYNNDTGEEVPVAGNTGWIRYSGKFRRKYELSLPKNVTMTPINLPLLRYSDVLLMWAEAVVADPNNTNNEEFTKALEYVNQVRRRGYGKPVETPNPSVDFNTEDKTVLFDYIKEERARELGHEFLRKDDLVRWGDFARNMQYVASLVPTQYISNYYVAARRYYGNASARDVLWPIPLYEMGVNRKLIQNDGW